MSWLVGCGSSAPPEVFTPHGDAATPDSPTEAGVPGPDGTGPVGEACTAVADGGSDVTIPTDASSSSAACSPSALDVKSVGAKGDGTTDDTAALQSAITLAGSTKQVLLPSGTYLVSSSLNLPAGANLCGSGAPVISSTTVGYILQSSQSGITITGLTLDGGGIELTSSGSQAGWQILYDTFQNITNGNDGVHVDNILGEGAASSISHNTFKNIWGAPGGFPNLPAGQTYSTCNTECIYGGGIFWHMGLDDTTIDDNTLDEIGYDAIKGFWDGFLGHTDPFEGHNVVISNNVMTNVHRMGIEVQAAGQDACPGGCNYSLMPTDGTVIKDNFFSKPAFTWNVFAYSLMVGGSHVQILNNTGNNDVATCYVRAGIGLENSLNGGLVQGNVIGSIPQSCYSGGWADFVACGYTMATYTNTYENNVFCGPGATAQGTVDAGEDPGDDATQVETGDLWTNSCAGDPDISSSRIVVDFTSPAGQTFSSGGGGTWNAGVVSNLSIKYVQFFVDAAKTPIVTQEVQDPSSSFPSDRTWRYHATFDTSSLGKGSHTIRAVATDVSKATQSTMQAFTR